MRLLVGSDGSAGARVAVEWVLSLPLSSSDEVTVLTAAPSGLLTANLFGDGHGANGHGVGRAREIAEEAVARFRAAGITSRALVDDGPAPDALYRSLVESAFDVVVIGSRGRGALVGAILGSTGRSLAGICPIPLLVVRERRVTPRRIIVAIDASDEGLAALDLLARLPLPADAEFTLLHLDPEGFPLTRHRAGAALQGRSLAHERASGVPTAQQVLSRAAALGADLLVLGSEGLAAHPGALALSIADEVLARAHCAVLLARLPPAWIREREEPRPVPAAANRDLVGRI